MPQFKFSEKDHKYSIDGIPVPSVSAVLSPLSDFSSVHPAIMANAISWGSNVHKTIELYLGGELDEENLDPHLKNTLNQFCEWWHEGPIRDEISAYDCEIETPRFHDKLRYAGTPDIAVRGYAIVDVKSRKCDPVKDILQLTAYEAFYGKPGSHRLIVLELYEDRYKEVDLSKHKLRKQAWGMFRTMLDRWHNENEFFLKLNGWKNKGR